MSEVPLWWAGTADTLEQAMVEYDGRCKATWKGEFKLP